jgi:hypothetical protein
MIKAGMRLAAAAAALGGWAAATTLTAADAAPALTHHPRVSAARPGGGPSSTGWASSNWSGYAKTGSGFTAVTGQWTVPSVSPTRKATYSASWVGIDGFNNSNLIQSGTEQEYYNGSAHYYAWWEILPAAETAIPSSVISVHPGDVMTVDIHQVAGSSFSITISDTTTNQSFQTTQNYTGPLTSAEWIEEAPTVGGHTATLAHYSSPTLFDPGTVNGGHNPSLQASDGGVMIQGRSQVSTPSSPDGDTDGFNMAYGSSAPGVPAS